MKGSDGEKGDLDPLMTWWPDDGAGEGDAEVGEDNVPTMKARPRPRKPRLQEQLDHNISTNHIYYEQVFFKSHFLRLLNRSALYCSMHSIGTVGYLCSLKIIEMSP